MINVCILCIFIWSGVGLFLAFLKSGGLPKRPEDFFFDENEKDPKKVMAFLIDVRDYIAGLQVPPGLRYMQMSHSNDEKIVGGDKRRPALLDASYPYFHDKVLSVSYPDFTPFVRDYSKINAGTYCFLRLKHSFGGAAKGKQPALKVGGDYLRVGKGLTEKTLKHAFMAWLEHYGVEFQDGSVKIGHDQTSSTGYIEAKLVHPDRDYERGRAIIQALIHGNQHTAEELHRDIEGVLGRQYKLPVFDKPKR